MGNNHKASGPARQTSIPEPLARQVSALKKEIRESVRVSYLGRPSVKWLTVCLGCLENQALPKTASKKEVYHPPPAPGTRKDPMVGKGAKERRQWPRLPLAIPVFVQGSDEGGKKVLEFSTILNVSAGGVLLAIRKQLRRNSSVWLEIPAGLPAAEVPKHAKRRLRARLLRISNVDGWYWCAARFYSPLK